MAKSRELKVVITGDAEQLDRTFARASKDVDQLGKKGEKMGRQFGTGMKVAGAAAAGALAVGLKQSAQAAIESEASMAKVKLMVENAGISWAKHGKEIDSVIQKQSKLSGLDDEELAESFANMIRTTGDLNEAFKLNGLAADIARTKGTGLAQAQSLLARVYNGSFTGLKRLGISLDEVTTAQDKLKGGNKKATDAQIDAAKATDKLATRQKAIAALQKSFGGQAEAYGKTAKGSVDRVAVAWENFQEVMGARLLPVITKVANKLSDLADWAAQNPGKFKAIAITIASVGAAISGLLIVAKVVAAIRVLRTAVLALNLAFLANPVVLVVAGLAALGAGLVIAYKKSETFRRIVDGAFNVVRQSAAAMFDIFTFGLRQFLTGIGKLAGVLSKVPGMGWLKGVERAAKGAAAKLADVSDLIRGVPKEKTLKLNVKLSPEAKRALTALNKLGTSVGGPMGTGSLTRAQGGIVPGTGRGDTVPMMAEPGEFVIRRRVVEKFGPTFFAAINDGRAPQFKTSGGIIARANAIDAKDYPYVWGGGHGRTGVPSGGTGRDPGIGYDCSGAVSAVLGVSPPRVSGAFTGWGKPGPGKPKDTKVYANAQHIFAVLNGRGWGTGRSNPGGGPGWLPYNHRPGFTIRHISDGDEGGSAAASSSGNRRESSEAGGTNKAERQARSGSRAVNRIAAPFSRAFKASAGAASSLATAIGDAGTRYGQTERAQGLSDEDLGTATGRAARISEIGELSKQKRKTLADQRKRAAALRKAIANRESLLKQLEAARKKAKGAKRAAINDRMRPIRARLDELKAELKALGFEIKDTELDLSDLDKQAGEVANTPDTVPDEVDAGPTAADKVSGILGDVELQERAGVITPEAAAAAKKMFLEMALGGQFGQLSERERWEVMAQLRDATQAQTQAASDLAQALKDVKASIDAQLAFAGQVSAITSMEAVRALSDIVNNQLGQRTNSRQSMPGGRGLGQFAGGRV